MSEKYKSPYSVEHQYSYNYQSVERYLNSNNYYDNYYYNISSVDNYLKGKYPLIPTDNIKSNYDKNTTNSSPVYQNNKAKLFRNYFSNAIKKMNKNPSNFTSFLFNRFSQDLTYYLMGSEKTPSLDISYVNDIGRDYFTSVSKSLVIKQVGKMIGSFTTKIALSAFDLGGCELPRAHMLRISLVDCAS